MAEMRAGQLKMWKIWVSVKTAQSWAVVGEKEKEDEDEDEEGSEERSAASREGGVGSDVVVVVVVVVDAWVDGMDVKVDVKVDDMDWMDEEEGVDDGDA